GRFEGGGARVPRPRFGWTVHRHSGHVLGLANKPGRTRPGRRGRIRAGGGDEQDDASDRESHGQAARLQRRNEIPPNDLLPLDAGQRHNPRVGGGRQMTMIGKSCRRATVPDRVGSWGEVRKGVSPSERLSECVVDSAAAAWYY